MFWYRISFLLVISFALSSCIETVAVGTVTAIYFHENEKTLKDTANDSQIVFSVWRELRKAKVKDFSQIDVSSYKARILLTGEVGNSELKSEAEKLVWKIPGVKEVINEVRISDKSPNFFFDYALFTEAKIMFMASSRIKSSDIEIIVNNRTIFLLGSQDSTGKIQEVARIASKIRGVKKVISYLKIKKTNDD